MNFVAKRAYGHDNYKCRIVQCVVRLKKKNQKKGACFTRNNKNKKENKKKANLVCTNDSASK